MELPPDRNNHPHRRRDDPGRAEQRRPAGAQSNPFGGRLQSPQGRGASSWISDGETYDPMAMEQVTRKIDLNTTNYQEWAPQSQHAYQLIMTLLSDDNCSEIHGNGPNELFAKVQGRHQRILMKGREGELTGAAFAEEPDYNAFLKKLVDQSETPGREPWKEIQKNARGVVRMHDGSSLTIVQAPFAKFQAFSIRKHNASTWTAQDLVDNGTMTQEMMHFLRAATVAKSNILVVGQMGSGKTSLLSLLTSDFGQDERVGLIEEVPEIWIGKEQVTRLTYLPTHPKYGLDKILDSALYMRMDRVIIGEIHLQGLTKMLEGMMYGGGGSMTTYHAGSAEQAVARMKIGLQLENPNMNIDTAIDMIRNSVELIVVLGRVDGVHRCLQIAEIDWRDTTPGKLKPRILFQHHHKSDSFECVTPIDRNGSIWAKAETYNVPIELDWFAVGSHRPAPGTEGKRGRFGN